MKRCTKCREEKPLDGFAADRRATDGTRSQCRECAGAYNREWNRANPDRVNSAISAYRKRHPARVRLQKAEWRAANPEKVAAHKRTDQERHAPNYRARTARWREENPDRHRANNRRRRALAAGAAGADYTTAEKIAARFAFYGGRCYYCGAIATSVDHRIPLVRGGSHWPANLVPACVPCNSCKNARTEHEFLELREGVIPTPP